MRPDHIIVGIGASAGGHEALKSFFGSLPADLNASYVVVTHLLRDHESRLSSIISRFTTLPVKKVSRVTAVEVGCVYVLAENKTIELKNGFIYSREREPNIVNKAINIFFESLADDQGSNAVGVILSGMGSDGANGALKIYEQGGTVLVQEPATAQFNSMPWSAIAKDHPDYILPPDKLAIKFAEIARSRALKVAK